MGKLTYNMPVPKSTYTEKEYPLVTDADVYVAVDGCDAAPGTFDRPVATFEGARNLVRELRKKKTAGGIKVAFKAGEYGPLSVALTAEDSGTEDCPITYCRYGDGAVVFNNGATLKLSDFLSLDESEKGRFSEEHADKIRKISLDGYFEAGLPAGITPYEGKNACTVARTPSKDGPVDNYYYDSIDPVNGDVHIPGMVLSGKLKEEADKCSDVENMMIRGYIVRGYRVDSFYVTGYDASTGILSIDPEREVHPEYKIFGVRTPGIEYDKVYLENNPKFLTSKGEFWSDSKTNTLYVYDPEADYNIGIHGKFLALDGVEYVDITGLTFKNCFNDNAITVKDSKHITFRLVKVEGVTGHVLANAGQGNDAPGKNTVLCVFGDSGYLTVTECDFSMFKNHGIDLFPNRDAVYLTENHIVVDNNFFHDCGNGNTFENNVIIDRSIGTRFTHNLFRDSESGAFELGTLSVIEYNFFDNMMTSTRDYGCIYTQLCNGVLSRGNIIRYNVFNQPIDNGENYCIYLDDGTSAMQVYGNLFYGCGAAVVIHQSRSHEIHDNLFIKAGFTINGLIACDEEGNILPDVNENGEGGPHWEWNGLYRLCMKEKPKEGEPGYEQWKEKFPDMYEYYVDFSDHMKKENLACPYNEFYDNLSVVDEPNLSEDRHRHLNAYAEKVGRIYNNIQYSLDENPCFADPSKGDYTISKGGYFFNIPFDQIGQY